MKRVAALVLAAALLGAAGVGAGCSPTPPTTTPQPHGAGSASGSSASTGGAAPSASTDPGVAPTASASASSALPKDEVPEPERLDVPDAVKTVLDNYDRLKEDKDQDPGRQPGMMFGFFNVAAGTKVAEIGPSDGYFIELFARVVGPTGKVYGVNNAKMLEKGADAWKKRLERPYNKLVVRLDRELDAPFPADVKDLDLVVIVQSYHDLYWLEYDRDAMNKAVFAALRPGGIYGVIDHAARKGQGATVVKTLHRIEPATLRKDIEASGFVFDGEATFLRNPRDLKDWSANDAGQENRGTTDRVVYRFKKP